MRIALAGDTMLGRGVAERLSHGGQRRLFAPEIERAIADTDVFLINLECCVSDRGTPWPNPDKPFFFRAPPKAAQVLADLGVSCVTLANNHALDFGAAALADTLDYLASAGIATVGAGTDTQHAHGSAMFDVDGVRLAILGVTDHPREFAAGESMPGVAYTTLRFGADDWLLDRVRKLSTEADVVVVSPHWGPNMIAEPSRQVRTAAETLVGAGAGLLAGHSAHVFHAISPPVLFDLGDFLDDYAVHPLLRNDLGLLFVVTMDRRGPIRIDAMPIALDFCHTRGANSAEYRRIKNRFTAACTAFGTPVEDNGDRLVVRCR